MLPVVDSLAGIVCIDPGVHTAITYWHNDQAVPECSICYAQKAVEYITEAEEISYATAIATLVKARLQYLDKTYGVGRVYVEGVQVHATSAKSMASAGRGNLSDIAYLVGVLLGMITREMELPCTIILPSDWKGQLNDKALRLRIQRCGVSKPTNEHIAASIGMGLSLRGWL